VRREWRLEIIDLEVLAAVDESRSFTVYKKYKCDVRFEVFTAVIMRNAVFLDVTPSGCGKNRRNESPPSLR
jgi:hypothetical protein